MAWPMNSWGDMFKVMKELRKDAVKARFQTIVIDTAKILKIWEEGSLC